MIKNKALLSPNHINLDNYFFCYEYSLEKENVCQVFINEDRYAVSAHPASATLGLNEINAKKAPPYLMGINQIVNINGYYLLHRKNEQEQSPWTATTNKIISEKPQEAALKQLLKSLSILVKKDEEKAVELMFMGNPNCVAQRLLVEEINSSFRATVSQFHQPEMKPLDLNKSVEFFMGNRLMDTLTNCDYYFSSYNGMLEIIKGINITLPTDYSVVKSVHHENESGSIKWVHESHIKDFLKNNAHTELLARYFGVA